ncbi:MAG: ribonuclease P protein component [Elusimicrobiota bacterium]
MKLSTKAQIQKLLDRGTRWGDGPIQFFSLPANGLQEQLGIIVLKKAYRRAVDRNRIKRLIRESWRRLPPVPQENFLLMVHSGLNARTIKLKDMDLWIKTAFSKKQRSPAELAAPSLAR